MRSDKEISLSARPGRAFSNGTSWEMWAYRWCDQCINDINENCPLIALAMFGDATPIEWVDSTVEVYECIEFEPREDAA